MKIYVLRHGQTDLNIQGKFQGRVNTELNETGKKQVQETKQYLEKINFDLVFSSPLKRTIQTAKIVTKHEIITDKRLIERSFGSLEGKDSIPDYEEKAQLYNVENIDQIKSRVYNFLDEIKTKYSDKQNILIVTHEGVAQIINSYFTKMDNIKDFRLNNGTYVVYNVVNKEKLMQKIENLELNRNLENFNIPQYKKNNLKKENLRIVYLMVWTKICGGSKIILEYSNRLAKKGHKITIISYDEEPTWFELDRNIEFIQLKENEQMEDSIPECDLVIPTSWKNIYQAVNYRKAPVTFFEQGGSHIFEVQNLSKEKYNTVKSRMEMVPFIHTVSEFSKEKIKQNYNKDSEVICNAVDSKMFYPRKSINNLEKDKIDITIIGSEGFKFKNINESLEVIRNLKRKYEKINLNWISQDIPKVNKEKAIVNPKQIEIGDILRNTDIFICNSEYESFCLPALEAMTCGAAVITTENGGIRDFVVDGYNALVVKKHNQQDLTEKVELLINDIELKEKLMKNGIETSKKFTWEESVNKVEKYYKEISRYKVISL